MPASPNAATARIATTIRDLTERMRRGSTLAMRRHVYATELLVTRLTPTTGLRS